MSAPADANPSSDPLIGRVVGGKWRVVRLIGRGGMGSVYEGQNVAIGKRVALKFIDPEYADKPEVVQRFQREAEAASAVESAHIVQVFDHGLAEDGRPFLVMELLRGEDLRTRLRRFGRLPCAEALSIVAQTLRGLRRAHDAGILHRDLKPDNIFLESRDDDSLFPKIVDFGVSKMSRSPDHPGSGTLTRQGVVLGTPLYMSPEQSQAFPDVGVQSDLWSVGAILYECLAGEPPFSGDSYEQIIVAICTRDPVDLRTRCPELPAGVPELVARALQRDRAHRFQSAQQMLDAIGALGVLSGAGLAAPIPMAPPGSGPRPPEWAAAEPAVLDAKPPPTRVSWTNAASPPLSPDPTTRRKKAVRWTVVGVVLALAGFVLTLAAMGANRSDTAPDERARATAAPTAAGATRPAAATSAAATSAAATTAAAAAANAEPSPPPASAPSAPTGAPDVAETNKRPRANEKPRGVKPPSPSPGASASPRPHGGVASGLQIKTSYP